MLEQKTNSLFEIKAQSNVPPSMRGREEELKRLYKTNKTLQEIAAQLKVSSSILGKSIVALGLKRQPRFKKKGYNKEKILSLEKLGLSHVKIAANLGVSLATLKRIYQYFGLNYAIPQDKLLIKKRQISRNLNKIKGIRPDCPYKTNKLNIYYDEIVDLLNNGVSKAEIARRYNVCNGTVFNFIYLNQLNAPFIGKCGDIVKIKDDFDNGAAQEKIARSLGCSRNTVHKKLKELNLTRPDSVVKRSSLLNNQEELIAKLYEKGLSGKEIAQQTKSTPIAVYNKIKAMNLSREQKWAEYSSTFKGRDEELRKLRASGISVEELGKYFGVHVNTVFYRLRKLGLTKKYNTSEILSDKRDSIIEKLNSGLSQRKLSAELDISRSALNYWIKKWKSEGLYA